ncbi:MAG: hypothetical protein OEY52_17175 [Gammaproteobacteria bacterium]|nr:hypothetical protein [Gammaproteobacteria bacterium]
MGNELDAVTGKEVCFPKSVGLGKAHGLAISCDNKLWAWGDNTYGQLGNPTVSRTTQPVLVQPDPAFATLFEQEVFEQVLQNSNGVTSFAISQSGNLWAWGPEYSSNS